MGANLESMIRATDLVTYARCPHRIHLDATADPIGQDPASVFLQLLWESGRLHEKVVVAGMEVVTAPHSSSAVARERATLELMREGHEWIYHGYLTGGDLEGEVDLLHRVEGDSELGEFAYEPVEIKSGSAYEKDKKSRPKRHYLLQLCAYAELIGRHQGVTPAWGAIIDRDLAHQRFDLSEFWADYTRSREEIRGILAGGVATRPGAKSDCSLCAWHRVCHAELEARDDLTLTAGVGVAYRDRIESLGIRTVADLAVSDPSDLLTLKGVGSVYSHAWPRQARAQVNGSPELLERWVPPEVDFEVSYDIEDFTPESFLYLHGLLVREAGGRRFGDPGFTDSDWGEFQPVIARPGDSDRDVWMKFLDAVDRLEAAGEYCVYVFSHHENTNLKRRMDIYGGSRGLDSFLDRFVDLYKIAPKHIVFPTHKYGLKALATYVGFDWRDEDPGGAQSMAWWAEYLEDPVANRHQLDRVLRYNEDDVRASFALRDWMEGFCGRR